MQCFIMLEDSQLKFMYINYLCIFFYNKINPCADSAQATVANCYQLFIYMCYNY